MELPFELWKEVSYYLPEHFLSFNKKLSVIYDEEWYEKMLTGLRYTKHNRSYRDLYRRWLKSGGIRSYDNSILDEKLPNNIIKVLEYFFQEVNIIMLTFDGDLYCYGIKTGQTILLDTNVKDIEQYCYIKEHELYVIEEDLNIKIVQTSQSPFLALSYDGESLIAAITINELHIYFMELDTIRTIDCPDNKNIAWNHVFMIHKNNGNMFTYEDELISKHHIARVKELYPYCVKLMNEDIVTFDYQYDFYLGESILIHKPVPSSGKLMGSSSDGRGQLLVIDNNLYRFTISGSTLELIRNNVKNVFEGYIIV